MGQLSMRNRCGKELSAMTMQHIMRNTTSIHVEDNYTIVIIMKLKHLVMGKPIK